jgi:hypothetical protein
MITGVSPSPVAELIALAQSKGQVLTEHTLRLLRNTLELRGVMLDAFVVDAATLPKQHPQSEWIFD